ncbi:hypothetical protein FE257_004578 [Aspergillus nanangensis]|uniref:Rhodopsin domain-containing protein n=1 Tax=Aspergillus nanangensis TaxID=2582783 RepID=A0AAD4GZH1_ASPNN|nr:hypothetical protein FE257_004578 [Aspergillus nanangensis]
MGNIAGALIATSTTLFAFTVIVAVIRVWSRLYLSRNFAVEDCLMVTSLLLYAALTAISYSLLQYGLGQHISNVHSPHSITQISKLTIALGATFVAGVGAAKISILLFYLKTFAIRTISIIVMILLVVTTSYTIACCLGLIFPCSPFGRAWDPTITHGYCIDRFALYYAHGGLNLAVDLAIIGLPLPLIWHLHVPKREKLVISALVTVCIIAVAVGSTRFWATHALQNGGDLTWHTALGVIFGEVEVSANIVCGSIIVMRPFFRRYVPAVIMSEGDYMSQITSSSMVSFV